MCNSSKRYRASATGVERWWPRDGNWERYIGNALAGHVNCSADRHATSDPRRKRGVVRAFQQAQVAHGWSGLHRLCAAVGYIWIGVILGYGVQGDIPGMVSMAAPCWIRSAIRGICGCILASVQTRGQVAGGVVLPARRHGVLGGTRHRNQPGLAPCASAC